MRNAFVGDNVSNMRELDRLSKRKSRLLRNLEQSPLEKRKHIQSLLGKVSNEITRVCQKLDVIARHS